MRSPKGDKLAGCNTQVAVLTRFSLIFIEKTQICIIVIQSVFVINVFHCSFTEYKIHDHGVGLGLEVPCFYHFNGLTNLYGRITE